MLATELLTTVWAAELLIPDSKQIPILGTPVFGGRQGA
jgi:hypothetical protein